MSRFRGHPPIRRRAMTLANCLAFCLALVSVGCTLAPSQELDAEAEPTEESLINRFARSYAYWASVEVRDLRLELRTIRSRVQSLPPYSPQMNSAGFHSGYAESHSSEQWVQVDLGRPSEIDLIALIPAFVRRDDVNEAGYGFPVGFRVEASDDRDFASSQLVYESDYQLRNPGKYPLLLRDIEASGRYVRVTCTQLASDGDNAFFALGELVVISGNRNIALWRPLDSSGAVEADLRWSAEYLVDGVSALPLPTFRQLSPTDGFESKPMESPDTEIEVLIDLQEKQPLDEVRLIPALPRDRPDIPGWGFPVRFRVELLTSLESVPVLIYRTDNDLRHWTYGAFVIPTSSRDYFVQQPRRSLASRDPLWNLPPNPIDARYVRIVTERLDSRVQNRSFFALAEIQVIAGRENVSLDRPVQVKVDGTVATESGRSSPSFLTDGFSSRRRLKDWAEWLMEVDELRQAEARMIEAEAAYIEAVNRVWSWNLWSGAGLVFCGFGWTVVFNYQLRRRHRRNAERLRNQIASDLHDDIGSNLGTIGLLCQSFSREHLTDDEQESLEEIREIAVETSDAMRDILWIIDPSSTRLEDFVGRLRRIAKRLLATIDVEFQSQGEPPNRIIPLSWRRNVFLSIKEVLHNAAKHSGATTVTIVANPTPTQFKMEITDNGNGFDVSAPAAGFGLRNIKRRIQELGGAVQYESVLGEGTTVRIEAPLPDSAGGTEP